MRISGSILGTPLKDSVWIVLIDSPKSDEEMFAELIMGFRTTAHGLISLAEE